MRRRDGYGSWRGDDHGYGSGRGPHVAVAARRKQGDGREAEGGPEWDAGVVSGSGAVIGRSGVDGVGGVASPTDGGPAREILWWSRVLGALLEVGGTPTKGAAVIPYA